VPILSFIRSGKVRATADEIPEGAENREYLLLNRIQLDRVIFGYDLADQDRPPPLESILEAKIEAAGRRQALSDSQKAKLALAGRGDIKSLVRRAEAICTVYEGHNCVLMSMDDARQFSDELSSLRSAYRIGPFDDGSYFSKALRAIRQREQADPRPLGSSDDRARTSRPSR
jgi:hypothetical protein